MTGIVEKSESYDGIVGTRLSRRAALMGLASTAALLATPAMWPKSAKAAGSSLSFAELTRIYDQTHHVAPDYNANILIRWGDPIARDVTFDPAALSADSQAKQFGYNCDFIGYMPLPVGSGNSEHGLLCVNNEYPDPHLMWPGMTEDDGASKLSDDQIRVMQAAWGHSVVEIKKEGGAWSYVQNSEYNRRINGFTEMSISGPAAGHALLKTAADPSGTKAIGTGYNCAGGTTPWGTILTCEEGLSDTFGGDAAKVADAKLLERYGYDGSDYYGMARVEPRLHLDKEPNEPNRFDWVVEIDPYQPSAAPVKRTALGRFAHEGATTIVNKDGRVAVYLGDDDYFEYLYRFVTKGTFNPNDREANKNLLDDGELSVAKLDANGELRWLPLVHGRNGLTAENGFADQGEVVIKARLAAELLGATPMDRPEDFEASPVNGKVYAVMTKNAKRKPEQVDPANPRPENKAGHILELSPPGEGKDADHAAATYKWDVFLLAGDPSNAGRQVRRRRDGQQLAGDARQHRVRSQGPPVDRDRRRQRLRHRGRALCHGDRRRRPCRPAAVLRQPDRRGSVRALLHAGRQDTVPRGPASGRGFGDAGQADDALAGLRRQSAAAALSRGHYPQGRAGNRRLTFFCPPDGRPPFFP